MAQKARRRKGNPVSGWVIIDKPEGPSSTQVVARVRRAFNAQKAGHAGTLDPLATGILPIALGEATKTIPFIQDREKTYRFTLTWGRSTTTDDREGETLETSPVRPDEPAIKAALATFVGEIQQVPPQFSAVHVDGKRAYDLARAGEKLDLAARRVVIHEARLLGCPSKDEARLEIRCSKGTYVRALARDLAIKLGTCAHVTALRRTRLGPFDETAAIKLDNLETLSHDAAAVGPPSGDPLAGAEGTVLLPLETALDDIPALALNGEEAARLKMGQMVLLRGRDAPILSGPVLATHGGNPVALTEFVKGKLQPVRVFML